MNSFQSGNTSADYGHIFVFTKASGRTEGEIAGHTVPQAWIENGYVKEVIDERQVDIFDLLGG